MIMMSVGSLIDVALKNLDNIEESVRQLNNRVQRVENRVHRVEVIQENPRTILRPHPVNRPDMDLPPRPPPELPPPIPVHEVLCTPTAMPKARPNPMQKAPAVKAMCDTGGAEKSMKKAMKAKGQKAMKAMKASNAMKAPKAMKTVKTGATKAKN